MKILFFQLASIFTAVSTVPPVTAAEQPQKAPVLLSEFLEKGWNVTGVLAEANGKLSLTLYNGTSCNPWATARCPLDLNNHHAPGVLNSEIQCHFWGRPACSSF